MMGLLKIAKLIFFDWFVLKCTERFGGVKWILSEL